VQETVVVGDPAMAHSTPAAAFLLGTARKQVGVNERVALDLAGEIVAQPFFEVKLSSAGTSSRPSGAPCRTTSGISTPPNRYALALVMAKTRFG